MRRQTITRFIMPMREGGSLPALVEADDGYKYVAKLRGSGHGSKSLIAELIGGEVARALGLRVPEIVLLDLPDELVVTEADHEVQTLLKNSAGVNVGLHFLSSALALDPYGSVADGLLASQIVWLDAFLTNVDRTARNTNMLQWYDSEVWLIDHGASLYFQYSGTDPEKAALTPFAYIKDHVFLRRADRIAEVDADFRRRLTDDQIDRIVDMIPGEWLAAADSGAPDISRDIYRVFLKTRIANSEIFTRHAIKSRNDL